MLQRYCKRIIVAFESGEFDVCTMIFNKFKMYTQEMTITRLIPAVLDSDGGAETNSLTADYEYEPEEDELLASLLPRSLSTQIYSALLGRRRLNWLHE